MEEKPIGTPSNKGFSGEKNAWTKATFQKMAALRRGLSTFKKKLKFSDLTEKTLTEFVVYLRDEKKLNTPRKPKGDRKDYDADDLVGIKNSSAASPVCVIRMHQV